MAIRDDRGDVKQTTTGFRGPLMVQSLTSAKSKFLSLFFKQVIFLTHFLNCKFYSLSFLQVNKDFHTFRK